jgi:hypothetical protein
MKKLRLNPDELQVKGFATQTERQGTGTVRAYATDGWQCDSAAYYGCYSSTCPFESEECTLVCADDTWGETQTNCSSKCSEYTCAFCTNVN